MSRSPRLDWANILEAAILGKLVATLIEEGYRIELSDVDGGGLFLYAVPVDEDNGQKPARGYNYWVRLVPGNGTDLIVDYTTNLENIIKPVNDFVALFT